MSRVIYLNDINLNYYRFAGTRYTALPHPYPICYIYICSAPYGYYIYRIANIKNIKKVCDINNYHNYYFKMMPEIELYYNKLMCKYSTDKLRYDLSFIDNINGNIIIENKEIALSALFSDDTNKDTNKYITTNTNTKDYAHMIMYSDHIKVSLNFFDDNIITFEWCSNDKFDEFIYSDLAQYFEYTIDATICLIGFDGIYHPQFNLSSVMISIDPLLTKKETCKQTIKLIQLYRDLSAKYIRIMLPLEIWDYIRQFIDIYNEANLNNITKNTLKIFA